MMSDAGMAEARDLIAREGQPCADRSDNWAPRSVHHHERPGGIWRMVNGECLTVTPIAHPKRRCWTTTVATPQRAAPRGDCNWRIQQADERLRVSAGEGMFS